MQLDASTLVRDLYLTVVSSVASPAISSTPVALVVTTIASSEFGCSGCTEQGWQNHAYQGDNRGRKTEQVNSRQQ